MNISEVLTLQTVQVGDIISIKMFKNSRITREVIVLRKNKNHDDKTYSIDVVDIPALSLYGASLFRVDTYDTYSYIVKRIGHIDLAALFSTECLKRGMRTYNSSEDMRDTN